MATYNLFKGGSKKLVDDIRKQVERLERVQVDLAEEIANEFIKVVQEEANIIDYNYQMYDGVYNNNVIESKSGSVRVKNTSQEATYSEFGTGLIGSENPNILSDALGWKYDVNMHGEDGWRYKIGDKYYFTKGVPSNPVYLISAQRVRKDLPNIIKRKLGKDNE